MRKPVLVGAAGLVMLIAGSALSRPRVSYGWTAYAPLSDQVFSPAPAILGWAGVVPPVVALLGLALLAGAVGYALGSRRREAPPPAGDGARRPDGRP